MPDVEFAQLLGFSQTWFALGVVNDAVVARCRAEWDKGHDYNTEHYRYGAFREFLAKHRPLTPELAVALYELGAADPDWAMGGAMMADIIRLSEGPRSGLDSAQASGRKHLVRLVERRSYG